MVRPPSKSPIGAAPPEGSVVSATQREARLRVAVIAVHGVGHHEPGASAEGMSNLLLGIGRNRPGDARRDQLAPRPIAPYSSFATEAVHVPLEPVAVSQPETALASFAAPDKLLSRAVHFLDERRGYIAEVRKGQQPSMGKPEEDRGFFGHEFMRSQLAGYEGTPDGMPFVTSRLKCTRAASVAREEGGMPPKVGLLPPEMPGCNASAGVEVHIYEAYWADLARPQKSVVSFFAAFYQLLFHLGSLARQAVDYASVENGRKWPWKTLSNLQITAVRFLVLPIPLLNLILLVAGLDALPRQLKSEPVQRGAVLAAAAVIGIIAAYFISWALRVTPFTLRWAWKPLLGALTGLTLGSVIMWFCRGERSALPVLLVMEWWLLSGALLFGVFYAYERVRKGALWTGGLLLLGNFTAFAVYLFSNDESGFTRVESASLRTMELVLFQLRICWAVMFICAFLAFCAGTLCVFMSKDFDRKARAKAAVRTGRLALALPTAALLLITIVLWSGVFLFVSKRVQLFADISLRSVPFHGFLDAVLPRPADVGVWLVNGAALDAYDYFRGLLVWSVTSGLPITLLGIVLAIVLLLWMVLPSVFREISARAASTNAESKHLGAWLSQGLDALPLVTYLLWFSSFLVPALFSLLDRMVFHEWARLGSGVLGHLTKATATIITMAGAAVAASAATIFAAAVKYGGTTLDTILDVDNYLRTSPVEATPRARIAERYVSLLRYVAAYEFEKGQGYNKVIIVAHSLGSLITADLLRFLDRECSLNPGLEQLLEAYGFCRPDGKARIPICLLTMGNPLRQLMNRFFPHLYWWVRDVPDGANWLRDNTPAAPPIPAIDVGALPDPKDMKVRHWFNTYRSGDYVGRELWLNSWYLRTSDAPARGAYPEPVATQTQGGRTEMCIGSGAHTHYWDRTAPDVSDLLDALICAAP